MHFSIWQLPDYEDAVMKWFQDYEIIHKVFLCELLATNISH